MSYEELGIAATQLREAGLVFPPVPESLVPGFQSFGQWTWGTRRLDPMGMYLFQHFGRLDTRVAVPPDYVALCQAGHGINSYALTYHLVYRPLAIIFQVGWGGGYSDPVKDANLFAHYCKLSAGLVDRITMAHRADATTKSVGLVECSEFRQISSFRVLNATTGGEYSETDRGNSDPQPISCETAYEVAGIWLDTVLAGGS